jgi:carboxymethylenebutenolidase
MTMTTTKKRIEVDTDGTVGCWIHRPEDERTLPGVLLWADAFNVRPGMHDMAARLAGLGYVVFMPELFHRMGAQAPFDSVKVFAGDEAERGRLFAAIRGYTHEQALADAAVFVRALRAQPGVAAGPIATMGYCMGGRLAFMLAGAQPDDVAAAASIHGGGLVTDAEDSPHLAAPRIKARLYFGVADNDPSCTPDAQAKLVQALATNHVRFTMDVFTGARHPFAVPDLGPYVRHAAELHWLRVAELFGAAFTPE